MKKSTTVKNYRILDYGIMPLHELLEHLLYFGEKYEELQSKKLDHKAIKKYFSIHLNLYNITEELFIRHPELKNAVDFEGTIQDILDKNSINANKN